MSFTPIFKNSIKINLEQMLLKVNAPEMIIEQPRHTINQREFQFVGHHHSGDTQNLITDLRPQQHTNVYMNMPLTTLNDTTSDPNFQSEEECTLKCKRYKCRYKTQNQKEYNEHITNHVNNEYICYSQGCSKRFTTHDGLRKHRLVHHFKQLLFKCRFCKLNYASSTALIYQEKKFHINDVPFKCIFPCILINNLFRLQKSFPCKICFGKT